MMIDMMRDPAHRYGAKAEIRIAAGKTGTSQDYRDAWFVGYTATLVPASGSATTRFPDEEGDGKRVARRGLEPLHARRARGSTPVPLPAAPWERAGLLDPSAPIADASAPATGPPASAATPGPLVMNAGGEAGQAGPMPIPDGGLRPPAPIPNGRRACPRTPPRPKSFLEAIFGN